MLAVLAAKIRQALVAVGGRLHHHEPDALVIEFSNGYVRVYDDTRIEYRRTDPHETIWTSDGPVSITRRDEVGEWVRAWTSERCLTPAPASG